MGTQNAAYLEHPNLDIFNGLDTFILPNFLISIQIKLYTNAD
jgi:hypothetical protein